MEIALTRSATSRLTISKSSDQLKNRKFYKNFSEYDNFPKSSGKGHKTIYVVANGQNHQVFKYLGHVEHISHTLDTTEYFIRAKLKVADYEK